MSPTQPEIHSNEETIDKNIPSNEKEHHDELEIQFSLDRNGRSMPFTPNTADKKNGNTLTMTSKIDYTTRSRQALLRPQSNDHDGEIEKAHSWWLDELRMDCLVADSPLLPRTFWMPAEDSAEKRCSLEQMAWDIFHSHVPRDLWNAMTPQQQEQSGAEWWVQLRPSPPGGRYTIVGGENSCTGNNNEQSETHGISFHWDKDEDLRLLMGGDTYLHPHISTVTYLTDHGAPTLALPCRIHPLQGTYISPHDRDDSNEEPSPHAFLSWPRTLKHLSFDGRYLHAAIPELAWVFTSRSQQETIGQVKRHKEEPRITFLVNIWLYYRPMNVNPFPNYLLDKLSGGALYHHQNHNNSNSSKTKRATPRLGLSICARNDPVVTTTLDNNNNSANNSTTNHCWPLGDWDSEETIELHLPTKQRLKDLLVKSNMVKQDHNDNICVGWISPSLGLHLQSSTLVHQGVKSIPPSCSSHAFQSQPETSDSSPKQQDAEHSSSAVKRTHPSNVPKTTNQPEKLQKHNEKDNSTTT